MLQKTNDHPQQQQENYAERCTAPYKFFVRWLLSNTLSELRVFVVEREEKAKERFFFRALCR